MFKRFLYNLHFGEGWGNLYKTETSKQFINLFLLIFLIFFGSLFFAFQGIVKAADSTSTTSSSTSTNGDPWSNPVLVGTTSTYLYKDDAYKAGKKDIFDDATKTFNATDNIMSKIGNVDGVTNQDLMRYVLYQPAMSVMPGQKKVLIMGWGNIYKKELSEDQSFCCRELMSFTAGVPQDGKASIQDMKSSGRDIEGIKVAVNKSGYGILVTRADRTDSHFRFGTYIYVLDKNYNIINTTPFDDSNPEGSGDKESADEPNVLYNPSDDSFYIFGHDNGQGPPHPESGDEWNIIIKKATVDANGNVTLSPSIRGSGQYGFRDGTTSGCALPNGDMYFGYQSKDNGFNIETLKKGATSTEVQKFNTITTSNKTFNTTEVEVHDIACSSDGSVYALVEDYNVGIYVARNIGGKWQDRMVELVDEKTTVTNRHFTHSASLSTTSDGQIFIAYPSGIAKMSFIYSSDQGATFSTPETIMQWRDIWIINAIMRVDEDSAVAHIIVTYSQSINKGQTDLYGTALDGMERRSFYAYKTGIKLGVKKQTGIPCAMLDTVRVPAGTSNSQTTSTSFDMNNINTKIAPVTTNPDTLYDFYRDKNTYKPITNPSKPLLTLSGSMKGEIEFTPPSGIEQGVLVQRNPGYQCLTNEYIQFLLSKGAITSGDTVTTANVTNDLLLEFHKQRYEKNPSVRGEYFTHPDKTDSKKSLESVVYNQMLDQTPVDSYSTLSAGTTVTDKVGSAYAVEKDTGNKVKLSYADLGIEGVNGVAQEITIPNISFGSNDFLGTQSVSNILNRNPIDQSSENLTASATNPYGDVYQSAKTTVVPVVSSDTTYPVIPLEVSGGSLDLKLKAPEKFASIGKAQEYVAALKKKYPKAAEIPSPSIYVGNDETYNILSSLYSASVADDCTMDNLLNGNDCPQLSIPKTFAEDNDDLSMNLKKLGLPYGDSHIIEQYSQLTNFDNELNTNNAFAEANTGSVTLKLTPSLKCTDCQTISSQPISVKLICHSCSQILGGAVDARLGMGALTDDTSGTGGKTPIVKKYYNYANNWKFVPGYVASGDSALFRFTDNRGLATTINFYNYFPEINAIRDGKDILPIKAKLKESIAKEVQASATAAKVGATDEQQKAIDTDTNAKLQQDWRIYYFDKYQSAGGIKVSSLDSSTAYGIVQVMDINGATPSNLKNRPGQVRAFKITKATDLSTIQLSSINLTNVGKIGYGGGIGSFSESDIRINNKPENEKQAKFQEDLSATQDLQPPQIKVTPINISNSCPQLGDTEVVSVVYSLVEKSTGQMYTYYVSNTPGYYQYEGNEQAGKQLTQTQIAKLQQDICNSYIKQEGLTQFADSTNWDFPTIVPNGAKIYTVTSTDSSIKQSNTKNQLLLVAPDPTNAYKLKIASGLVQQTGTTWFKQNNSDSNAYLTTDLSNINGENYYTFDFSSDFEINENPQISYVANISSDGKKDLFVTFKHSTKVVHYSWNNTSLSDNGVTKTVFDLSSLLPKKPNEIQVVSYDEAPQYSLTGAYSALGFNLTFYDDTKKNTYDPHVYDKTYPVILERTKYGYISHIYDPDTSKAKFEDNTMVYDNGKQILDYKLKEVKYTYDSNQSYSVFPTGGDLNAFIQMTSNSGVVSNVIRDEAMQYVVACSSGTYKYTRFFNITNNSVVPNCSDFPAIAVPVVSSSSSPIQTDITDVYSLPKYRGKLALENSVRDVNSSKETTTSGTSATGGSDQRPSDEYAQEIWGPAYPLVDKNVPDSSINEAYCSSKNYLSGSTVQKPFACDKYDTELKTKLKSMVRNPDKSLVDQICEVASNRGVSCALIVAIWGQETGFGTDGVSQTSLTPFGCDLSNILGNSYGFTGNLNCAVNTIRFWFNDGEKQLAANGYIVQPGSGQFSGNSVKFSQSTLYALSRYTPLDPKINADNQNNLGLVVKDSNGKITDTRPNIRTFTNLGVKVYIADVLTGDVSSTEDPRIVYSSKIYKK